MTTAGTGAATRQTAASAEKPHPYPTLWARGGTVKGKKAPSRHRATSKAVVAEAEYAPKASVMKVIMGTMERTTATHSSETVER